MEPQLPRPKTTEQAPNNYELVQQGAEAIPNTIEKGLSNPENNTRGGIATAQTQVTQLATPGDMGVITSQAGGAQSNPVTADDDDVIEKEWVDRSKQVINKTREDPRQQKQEVNMLQADYLLKRYNKKIKLNNSDG